MEDLTIQCPFCCTATFSSKESLVDHLSHIVERLVCPICKNSISSLDSLITHLKYDNCIETILLCQYTNGNSNKVEQTDVNLDFEENENVEQNENCIENNSEDISEVSKIYSELLSKHIDIKTQDIKLLKENGNRYLLVTNNDSALNGGATLVSKQNNDGTISFSIQESNVSEANDLVENEQMDAKTENQNQLDLENSDNIEEMYSCNTCGVSFTSVMDHIQNYHNDEDVVVEEPLEDGTTDSVAVEYESVPEEAVVEKQASRRMITDTGDIIEEPLRQNEQNGQVRVIIPINKDGDVKLENKQYIQVDKLGNSIVKENAPVVDTSNLKFHKVVMKTMEAPNGNKVKVYNCTTCNYLVSSLSEFRSHPCKNRVISEKYICPHCSVMYDNPKSLCAHMKVHKEKPATFACPVCPDVFDEPNSLCNHINEHKGNSDTSSLLEPIRFDCEVCSTKFPTSKSLKLHKRMHDPIKARPIEPPVETTEGSDKYLCLVCFKLIPVDYKVIHQNSHKVSSEMICDICNKKFPNKEYLEMHMNVHNMDKVTVGKQDNTLPYHCLYCNRKFARPHEKVKHERIHTGEKPHSCEICGKSFRVSYCLTLHMRTHTGARPYECPHCPKRFKAHSVYNHHLLTHSEVRAYKCPFCPKAFKTSVQLAGHKNSHTKPFSCQQCNRPFASLYAVRVHMEVHTRQNNLKFSCSACGASYARAFALRDHQRTAHTDRLPHTQFIDNTLKVSEVPETEEISLATDELNKELPNDINEIEMKTGELIIP
ncbi:oocyte zinc finger protein XlCOF22-like isoform X1 [Colias croceus]|uniref:oocyte zinc finger protein XlCOF22-like isoform X1 n=1 Tax=Colias crocea TaxID=72248 RepID=UPI001E27EB82|nr:oocyte zinc finger protein XlCOF22-like isoform X1 [Colias croceus]